MLKVSECSTCDDPFPSAQQGEQQQSLATEIALRRGPIDSLLVTRANLEIPLPLIDIVNECLEHAANTLSPIGTVYNTFGDALAGHQLCAEECCPDEEKEEEKKDAAACHDPATLFAALPEYSTPGTPSSSAVRYKYPGLSNAEVEPAVYNALKKDFSSCCLPYSQALDVSRTYTEHFRTCRFELMRTFRKCITEFVLDPAKPPAGFRSYEWRYPVRIDIAIEYLKITPEEYTLLFGGVWPAACDAPCDTQGAGSQHQPLPPWQLYGFATQLDPNTDQIWTSTVVHLSEFLKRTCLTYCEFLDIWKSGFVKFNNIDQNNVDQVTTFPDCEPCCLEKLQLTFTGVPGQEISFETPLYELAVFIRLWRKLKGLCGGGYSFEQLADICTVLPLFNAGTATGTVTINPEFIRQLIAFQMLRDQLRLPLTDDHATIAPGATSADRTFLLSLWPGTGHQWDWALARFIEGIEHYAVCRFKCERREPEFLKHLAGKLDCLSLLAGFDSATANATWHYLPAHTLRFAEVLAKVYASKFSIGEILFLFAADDCLCGPDEHEDKDEHEPKDEHERKHSPWQLRRKLIDKHVPKEDTEDWTWTRLESALQHEFGCAGAQPPLQRQQAMFDCWERIFDYDRVRKELGERSECHLRFFQDKTVPVYALTTDDLEDDRWMVRCGHADRWIESLSKCFRVKDKDIEEARPELWASDDPAALVVGEMVTGNASLSQFLGDGCLESGAPRLYDDLKTINDGLRERGRCALLAYLGGAHGIGKTPKVLSDLLLLDVETGLCEKASRIEEAITAVQTFIQRCRIGLEPGWNIAPRFAHMWDSRFASYHIWQACKRRELYKENWIDWHELEKAKKIESFRFMDEELRRVSLTIAAPGGVDYWPEHRPPAPGLCLLQDRDPATMQLLPVPPATPLPAATREGLALLATPERGGRSSWITTGPVLAPPPPPPPPPATPVAPTAPSAPAKLPFWMECAIKLGTRFVRVAAAGYSPASTPFEPWKSSRPVGTTAAGTTEECCVDCCAECGCRHPAHVDEYYFWLVDGRHFDPQSQKAGYNTYDTQQNSFYDPTTQEAAPWHYDPANPTLLPNLLEWPSDPMVRLAWCRVHNEEFRQPRISVHGIDVKSTNLKVATVLPDLSFQGRSGDSLYFEVTNLLKTPGFRYDLAVDETHVEEKVSVPASSLPSPLSGLMAHPYFAYFHPGARLFPWSMYSPAVAVANALRAHCRFEAALKWYDLYYDPLTQDNTWTTCQEQQGQTGAAGEGSVVKTSCCDSTDVSCHVARNRSVMLNYLETLVEWGDALMRPNSPEQFQQARVIFDNAGRILGLHPRKVVNPAAVGQTTALETVSNFTPLLAPVNPRLMMLYDRVDDRMALIHDRLGKQRLRQASQRHDAQYWGNDPVRDGWRNDLCHCCEDGETCHPHSPYRFTFLIQKAKELANQTRELGGALLAAFEKGDAEYLASVRALHERELLVLGRKIREGEWRDADFQVQALLKTKESDQASWRYYKNLIAAGLITNENNYVLKTGEALGDRTNANKAEFAAEALIVLLDWFVGQNNFTWLPLGTKLSDLSKTIARYYNTLADIASTTASLDLTQAGWDRRMQDVPQHLRKHCSGNREECCNRSGLLATLLGGGLDERRPKLSFCPCLFVKVYLVCEKPRDSARFENSSYRARPILERTESGFPGRPAVGDPVLNHD
jgi:hypothetical protein